MTKEELLGYAAETFGAEPEYLWKDYPDICVLRHADNRKWFAAVMSVPREKFGLAGAESVWVLNVKCGPLLSGSYLGQSGVFPAWHMNKTHWLSVLLDGAADETVRELLGISYDLTRVKRRNKERGNEESVR